MIDEILEKYNLKYEDLNSVEKETLNSWMSSLEINQLTLEKVRDYITSMRESVEYELAKIGHESKQDIYLKARLRNYLLIEGFLSSPEKARKAIERSLASITSKPSPLS